MKEPQVGQLALPRKDEIWITKLFFRRVKQVYIDSIRFQGRWSELLRRKTRSGTPVCASTRALRSLGHSVRETCCSASAPPSLPAPSCGCLLWAPTGTELTDTRAQIHTRVFGVGGFWSEGLRLRVLPSSPLATGFARVSNLAPRVCSFSLVYTLCPVSWTYPDSPHPRPLGGHLSFVPFFPVANNDAINTFFFSYPLLFLSSTFFHFLCYQKNPTSFHTWVKLCTYMLISKVL